MEDMITIDKKYISQRLEILLKTAQVQEYMFLLQTLRDNEKNIEDKKE